MDISIGKYRLSTDACQYIISEPKARTTGNHIGTMDDTDQSFHATVEQALNNVMKRRLLKSDATTLLELKNEIASHRKEMQALLKEVV